MALLEAKSLSMTFAGGPPWARRSIDALREIDLNVEPGEVIGVVGESGSGKSTLGNVFIGRMNPTGGQLLYRGRVVDAAARRERAGKFAAVLQHPKWSLNPMLRVLDSVAEPLKILGRAGNRENQRRLVGHILEQVGLPGSYQDRFPHELSGGQRQRVSIARALITKPEFVLFDEAVSALDVSVQAHVLNMIRDLQRSSGFSAIFISHDLAATRYVASRIAVLYAGRLVEDAPASNFYDTATHPYSRGLQFASGLLDNPSNELGLGNVILDTKGCPLAERCPLVQERCNREDPVLRKTGNARAACHLVEAQG
ncbi:MAG: ABC transporter ATP-binding protein [Nitratireductor sp.]